MVVRHEHHTEVLRTVSFEVIDLVFDVERLTRLRVGCILIKANIGERFQLLRAILRGDKGNRVVLEIVILVRRDVMGDTSTVVAAVHTATQRTESDIRIRYESFTIGSLILQGLHVTCEHSTIVEVFLRHRNELDKQLSRRINDLLVMTRIQRVRLRPLVTYLGGNLNLYGIHDVCIRGVLRHDPHAPHICKARTERCIRHVARLTITLVVRITIVANVAIDAVFVKQLIIDAFTGCKYLKHTYGCYIDILRIRDLRVVVDERSFRRMPPVRNQLSCAWHFLFPPYDYFKILLELPP